MDVTPLIPEGRQIIQAYGPDGFKVNGIVHPSAVLVFPERTEDWVGAADFSALDVESFAALTRHVPNLDVVLLGTGGRSEFFPPTLKQALKNNGLVVEAMESGAACRTYNVLMAEGRRVAAALLPLI